MSPINIQPINKLNLQTRYSTLSQYAQRFVKSQIKSISFELERFFSEIDPKIILENEQKLKEQGIKQIGKDITEGVIILGDKYDYHVYASNEEALNFNILKPETNEIYKHFSINEKGIGYHHSENISDSNAEDELTEVLDFVDGKLLNAKKIFVSAKIPLPYIPNQATSEKLGKLDKTLLRVLKNSDIKNAGYIGSAEEEIIDSIVEKLKLTQELYKKISDCRTKYKVRSSYKNYMPQPVTNKMGFKGIGPNGESISLFQTSFKNNTHTAIIITNANGKESKFVISKDKKTVQKNFPSKFVKSDNSEYRIFLTPDYYTQKEVKESNLNSYLSCLNKEMDLFIEHTQNWFNKKEERKLIRENHDSATLDKYKDLIDNISSNFKKYQTKMRKYLRKPHKSTKFKIENNISTKLASRSVKFDKITPEGYDLRLSYPKVKDKIATQLLVMQGDKIKDSFYIINDKLLRFDIKDLNRKFSKYDQNMYYYDNKYLQNSKLEDYLLLLKDKLHDLNKKLDVIRKKQIENRIKYHIKSPKDKPI